MISKVIFLTVLILMIAIFFIPIYVFINFTDELAVEVRFCFLRFKVNDKKQKVKTSKNIVAESGDKNKFKDILKKRGLSGFLNLLRDIASATSVALNGILKRLKVDRFVLNITVRSEDAASTAIKYGTTCAAVYPVIGILESKMNIKNSVINVESDFQNPKEEDSNVDFKSKFHISIGQLLIIAFDVIKNYIKRKRSFNDERTSN